MLKILHHILFTVIDNFKLIKNTHDINDFKEKYDQCPSILRMKN
jgi:hypothetical protein